MKKNRQPALKYYSAVTRALSEEMRRDKNVILIGEDVGPSGGIFAQTKGLHAEFGPSRVRDTPIAEAGFTSLAVGAAMTGLRPIVEVGFEDFLTACMDPIVNQGAKLRYMLGGQVRVPVTLYTFGSGGLSAGPQHSQSLAAWFAHVPGVKVIQPSSARDALGLLKSSVRDDNFVICLLCKSLIGSKELAPSATEDFLIPIGQAEVKKSGSDVTIIALGAMVKRALAAADILKTDGIDAEVIDPRTISPLDMTTILKSVSKTNTLIVVHEAMSPCGIGAEIVARVCETSPSVLRSAPVRITPPFAPSPFAPNLEADYLPSVEKIVMKAKLMLEDRR